MATLLGYLTETATLFRRVGVNAYGEDMRDTGREITCRVRLKRLTALLADGASQRCAGEAWLASDEQIAPGDQLLYDGEYLTVHAVECIQDIAGDAIGLRATLT